MGYEDEDHADDELKEVTLIAGAQCLDKSEPRELAR